MGYIKAPIGYGITPYEEAMKAPIGFGITPYYYKVIPVVPEAFIRERPAQVVLSTAFVLKRRGGGIRRVIYK